MNYEKEYKEAIKKANTILKCKELYNVKSAIESIFPELAESEDERIRKVLVGFFKSYKEEGTCGSETFNEIPTDNILAWLEKQGDVKKTYELGFAEGKRIKNKEWLEKQGEQKPVNDTDEDIVEAVKDTSILDLAEPKFKVGDWITIKE